jgi:MFS family permease
MSSAMSGDARLLVHDPANTSGGDDKSHALLNPLVPQRPAVVIQASCTRWWCLFLFCCLAICQGCTWNIFSPIAPALALAFPTWSSAYVNWVINTANIAFVICLFVTPVLVNKLGPRAVMIMSFTSVLVGAALRTLPLPDAVPMQVVVVMSMVFNGCGGE